MDLQTIIVECYEEDMEGWHQFQVEYQFLVDRIAMLGNRLLVAGMGKETLDHEKLKVLAAEKLDAFLDFWHERVEISDAPEKTGPDDGPTEAAKYVDFTWIKVKKWADNPHLSFEERFRALEKHHMEETKFLLEEIKELAAKIDKKEKRLREFRG